MDEPVERVKRNVGALVQNVLVQHLAATAVLLVAAVVGPANATAVVPSASEEHRSLLRFSEPHKNLLLILDHSRSTVKTWFATDRSRRRQHLHNLYDESVEEATRRRERVRVGLVIPYPHVGARRFKLSKAGRNALRCPKAVT